MYLYLAWRGKFIWHGEVNSFTDFLKRAQIGNATYTVKEEDAPEWTINIIHSNNEVFVVFSILSDDGQRGEMAKFGNKLEFLGWLGKMSKKMKLKFQ